MEVGVGIAEAAAEEHEGLIQQRTHLVLRVLEPAQEIGQHVYVMLIDLL